MKPTARSLAIAALVAATTMVFAETPTAASVLSKARAQAKRERKNVLLIFHASWCGWCHKLDDMLASADAGPTMSKAYVVVHLVVDESKDKKSEENPGAAEVRETLGGGKAGLPFFAILSPAGKSLGTSIAPGAGNIGYPAAPNEIAHFMGLLKATSPKLSDADRAKIESYLKVAAAKIKTG